MRTGDAQAREDAKDTESFLNFLQDFLLAFGGIALFVGSFVIANSLSITIAQRTRELATLRTLGASRRQVLGSIIVESLVIGLLSSIVGILVGLGLGTGLFKLFDAVGFTLPNNGLVLHTRTIVVAMIVGVVVTLVASLRPAFRSTRVPPIAAVREGATLPPGRFARFRLPAAIVLTSVGFAALAYGLFGRASERRRSCSTWASARCWSSSARRCCRRASRGRSRTCSAGLRRRSAAPPARSHATTRSATRSGPRRLRRR